MSNNEHIHHDQHHVHHHHHDHHHHHPHHNHNHHRSIDYSDEIELLNILNGTVNLPNQLLHTILDYAIDKSYKILLLGEVGSGKSLLINMFCNYFRGGTLNNIKVIIDNDKQLKLTELDFIPNGEDNISGKQYHTKQCNMYKFTDSTNPNNVYTMIDTPGFGINSYTTPEVDFKSIESILDTLKQMEYIHCIALTFYGSINASNEYKSRLQLFMNNCPDAILDKLVVINICDNNHSNSSHSNNHTITMQPYLLSELIQHHKAKIKRLFSLNPEWNSYIKQSNHSQSLQTNWNETMVVINDIIRYISNIKPANTRKLFELLSHTKGEIVILLTTMLVEIQKLHSIKKLIKLNKPQYLQSNTIISKYKNNNDTDPSEEVKIEYNNAIVIQNEYFKLLNDIDIIEDILNEQNNSINTLYNELKSNICTGCNFDSIFNWIVHNINSHNNTNNNSSDNNNNNNEINDDVNDIIDDFIKYSGNIFSNNNIQYNISSKRNEIRFELHLLLNNLERFYFTLNSSTSDNNGNLDLNALNSTLLNTINNITSLVTQVKQISSHAMKSTGKQIQQEINAMIHSLQSYQDNTTINTSILDLKSLIIAVKSMLANIVE